MQLQSENIAVDMIALRKQLKLRPDEKNEAYHIQELFTGRRWHVLADAGGSQAWWDHKRFIGASATYENAMKCYQGWGREKPVLIYFQDDGTAIVVETFDYKQQIEAKKNKLALIEQGLIQMSEKEKNKLICEVDPTKVFELGQDYGPDNIWQGIPCGKVYWNRVFQGRAYTPLHPHSDYDRIAAVGDRLMVRHGSVGGEPELFIAPKDVVSAGWVIGLFKQ